MQTAEVLGGNSTGVLPPLSDGAAGEAANHGLVVHSDLASGNVWLDFGIALVVAIAAPFLLKKLLESEFAARFFRTPSASQHSLTSPTDRTKTILADEDFDFDA